MPGGRDRSRSLDQNPLASVLPLDWLFSDNEPDPPGSPKGVQQAAAASIAAASAQEASGDIDSSRASSGTDCETRNLLPSLEQKSEAVIPETEQSSGAIPKKRSLARDIHVIATTDIQDNEDSYGAGDAMTDDPGGSAKTWQRRAFRRRRTQDQMSVEGISESAGDNEEKDGEEEDHDSLSSDLRQKILDILAQDDSDQNLDKLRSELVLRKERVRRKMKQQMERHREHSDRNHTTHMGAPLTSVVVNQATSPSCVSSASNVAAAVPRRSAGEEEARREKRRLRRAARRRGVEQQQQQQQQEVIAKDGRENSRRSSSGATTYQTSVGGLAGSGGDGGVSSALATMFGQQVTGAHIAVDHADTSEGAVHCFQDELGNWHTYRFGSDSTGIATQVNTPTIPAANGNRLLSTLLQSADAPAQNSGGKVNESRCSNPVISIPNTNAHACHYFVNRSGSYSNISDSSGLTVLLDSPVLVWQPSRQGDDGDRESGGYSGSLVPTTSRPSGSGNSYLNSSESNILR